MQVDTRTLWCMVHGDAVPFEVTIRTEDDADDLKGVVYQKGVNRAVRDNILPKDMTLWMVCTTRTTRANPITTTTDYLDSSMY
jgi:hypothetical protein